VLPHTFEIQKHLCEVPCRKNGKQGFWHHGEQPKAFPSDHDLITCDMQVSMLEQQLQATYHEHQGPLQDIHHVHSDLEDLAFQDFMEEIVLSNGLNLPMRPCLVVVTRSLLGWHDNPFSKLSKEDYAQLFPAKVVGNNGNQESCALTVTGAIPIALCIQKFDFYGYQDICKCFPCPFFWKTHVC